MACCASFPWALIEKTCFLESITSRRLEIRKTMITTIFGKWLDHLDGPASRLSITTIFFCKWPAPSIWAGLMQTGKSITTKYSFFLNGPYHPDGQHLANRTASNNNLFWKWSRPFGCAKRKERETLRRLFANYLDYQYELHLLHLRVNFIPYKGLILGQVRIEVVAGSL